MNDQIGTPAADVWRRRFLIAWTAIGWAVLLTGVLWLLGRVSAALVPFLLAAVVVLLFRGPVDLLQRRGLKRGPAVLVCFLAGLAAFSVVAVFIVPAVARQVAEFVSAFPAYYRSALGLWQELQARYAALRVPGWMEVLVERVLASLGSWAVGLSSTLAAWAVATGQTAVTFVMDAVLAFVIGFWLLKDLPTIRDEVFLLVGPERREEAQVVGHKVSTVLGGYLRGQLLVSLATAALVTVGLAVLRVPYALVLGLLTGALNIVPYVGPAIGAGASAIVAAFVNPWLALGAIVVVVVSQQITDLFVTPRIMSSQVDLHPVLVILSLLAGATLFGVPGMLLAIPVAAVGKGLFVHYFEKNTQRAICTDDGALFRKAGAEGEDVSCDEPATPEDEESA